MRFPGRLPRPHAARMPLPGILALVAVLSAATAEPVHGQHFSAWPAVVRLTVAPDTSVVAVIQVRNDGTADLPLRFHAGDFEQDEVGDHQFLAPGEHPRSCHSRMRIFPSGAVLSPGQIQEVRVQVGAPDQACWSFVYAEAVTGALGGISVGQRIGVKLFASRPEVPVLGEVASIQGASSSGGPEITLQFRNTGESPLRASGTVDIRSLTGDVLHTAEVRPFTVLPGAVRKLVVDIPGLLPAGRYLTVALVDFGGEYISGGQAQFDHQPVEAGIAPRASVQNAAPEP
jgi:hypothetical protein